MVISPANSYKLSDMYLTTSKFCWFSALLGAKAIQFVVVIAGYFLYPARGRKIVNSTVINKVTRVLEEKNVIHVYRPPDSASKRIHT
jgi:hypothetical protein